MYNSGPQSTGLSRPAVFLFLSKTIPHIMLLCVWFWEPLVSFQITCLNREQEHNHTCLVRCCLLRLATKHPHFLPGTCYTDFRWQRASYSSGLLPHSPEKPEYHFISAFRPAYAECRILIWQQGSPTLETRSRWTKGNWLKQQQGSTLASSYLPISVYTRTLALIIAFLGLKNWEQNVILTPSPNLSF